MNSVDEGNPAGRLFRMLNLARAKPDGYPAKRVWSEVINQEEDSASLFSDLAKLQQLACEVKNKINEYAGEDQNHYLTTFSNIEHLLRATNLDAAWSGYKHLLSDSVMTELRFCSLLLSKSCSEKIIEEEKLKELSEEVEQLLNDVLGAAMDTKLIEIVADFLAGIKSSISEYRIRGAKSLQRHLERVIGEIVFYHGLFSKEEGSDIVKRVWSLMVKVNDLTTFAINSPAVLTGSMSMLKALSAS